MSPKERLRTVFLRLRLGAAKEAEVVRILQAHGLNKREIDELLRECKFRDNKFMYTNKFVYSPDELELKALEMPKNRPKARKVV